MPNPRSVRRTCSISVLFATNTMALPGIVARAFQISLEVYTYTFSLNKWKLNTQCVVLGTRTGESTTDCAVGFMHSDWRWSFSSIYTFAETSPSCIMERICGPVNWCTVHSNNYAANGLRSRSFTSYFRAYLSSIGICYATSSMYSRLR